MTRLPRIFTLRNAPLLTSEEHIALLSDALLVPGAVPVGARPVAAAATHGARNGRGTRSALGEAARQLGAFARTQQSPAEEPLRVGASRLPLHCMRILLTI